MIKAGCAEEDLWGLSGGFSYLFFTLCPLFSSLYWLLGRWDGKHTLVLVYYKDLTSSHRILNSAAIIRQYVRQLIYFIAILLLRLLRLNDRGVRRCCIIIIIESSLMLQAG